MRLLYLGIIFRNVNETISFQIWKFFRHRMHFRVLCSRFAEYNMGINKQRRPRRRRWRRRHEIWRHDVCSLQRFARRHNMSLHQDENDLVLRSRCKYVHLKSHSAAQITRQNLVIILQQLLYHSKISFIALSEEYVALGRFLSDLLHKTYFYYINFEYCRHTPNLFNVL